MRLAVGLTSRSVWWEHLLAQEGVPFGYADLTRLDEQWSVLVITHAVNDVERRQLEDYLASRGAILGYAGYAHDLCNMRSRRETIEYMVSDGSPPFADTYLLDLGIVGEIPGEANCLRTPQQTFAAFAGPLGGGHAVILPFDPAAMMADSRAANKNFYAVRDRLPSERVSLVGKGEIQRLVHRSLAYLHHARGLPYAHLWYFPEGRSTVFAFRIDSDKGSREDIDALQRVAVKHDIRMTWFLDVKAHEGWLHHFAYLSGQEFGVHCYEHMVFNTYEANLSNILKARQKLDRVGVSAPGFAAPFGIWSPELARAIDQAGFEYSSEFSYAYDALPLYAHSGSDTFATLQVPIHPVCIGTMRRVGYSETQMAEYFRRVMDEKMQRNESWFFYHHPTHRAWDVVEFIFQYVREKDVECVTMAEYARWWKKRLKARTSLVLRGQTLLFEGPLPDASVRLHVVLPDMRTAHVAASASVDLETLRWNPPSPLVPPPADIHRIREFDPRKVVGELFTSLSRKFSERRKD